MELQLLLTGNEIMSGDTVDSNSSTIAQKLMPEGYWVDRKVTVGDDFDVLVREIKHISASADALIINGGLGPTIDDLTAEALAQAAGIELEENAEAHAHVLSWCEQRGFSANGANLKQARLPVGVRILPNSVGSAVGFALEIGKCLVLCTPGPPSELRAVIEDGVKPMLAEYRPQPDRPSIRRYQTFGLGESGAQQAVLEAYPDWPDDIELGFRAGAPLLEMKLRIDADCPIEKADLWEQNLLSLIGPYVIGRDDTTLAEAVVELLKARGETVTTAESCTGGQIAAMLTSVPGASAVFEAGIVSYSNSIKQRLLNVSDESLSEHGAVSEAVVLEMAKGALAQSNADWAVAVSGVAGPDGGSEDKPVGTVWVAWGQASNLQARSFYYPLGRSLFQTITAALSLDLIRRDILGLQDEPAYFRRKPR